MNRPFSKLMFLAFLDDFGQFLFLVIAAISVKYICNNEKQKVDQKHRKIDLTVIAKEV